MRALYITASLIILGATTACTASSGDNAADTAGRSSRRVEIGQEVPSYSALSLTGGADSLDALRGRVVMLNVWATWCVPCRTELPDLQALHERYESRGLSIVGVSIDGSGEADQVREFAHERGVTYAIWHDPQDRITGMFLANGVPATYLIGRDGRLRYRWMGPLAHNDTALVRRIEEALSE